MAQRFRRLALVLTGLIVGQFLLYGPSLTGRKILLPLDQLAVHDLYLPPAPGLDTNRAQDFTRMDLVTLFEPMRRFAAAEIQAGRLPLWFPNHYAGAPLVWPKFSPFLALESCFRSPVVLAWAQLLAGLTAGLGAYCFFRRVLAVSFWPAALCAWCYPLTGFFIFWQGYATGLAVYWLPWMLLAVDRTVRGPGAIGPLGLALATGLTLVSGQVDVAGQVLLGSGLYALWCLVEVGRGPVKSGLQAGRAQSDTAPTPPGAPASLPACANPPKRRQDAGAPGGAGADCVQAGPTSCFNRLRRAGVALVAGWTLGVLLAAPSLLPLVEYLQTGARVSWRASGGEERPPLGLSALPQAVLPDIYGSTIKGSYPLFPPGQNNLQESSAAAYAGLVVTFFAAPLAFCRRPRRQNWFWLGLAGLGLSWCLNVPGVVQVLRLPGLNMMSHNRLVFLSTFALLALGAAGLETLAAGPCPWRRWLWLPGLCLLGLGGWCAYRTVCPPDALDQFEEGLLKGQDFRFVHSLEDLHRIQSWFEQHFAAAAVFCALGVAAWLLLRFTWTASAREAVGAPATSAPSRAPGVGEPAGTVPRWNWGRRLLFLVGVVMFADLLWFAYGRNLQCDPALYYPPLPVFQQVAQATPGRVLGFNCLPALLSSVCGLCDVRGYDGIDPARMVDLLEAARDPNAFTSSYGHTQWLTPKTTPTPDGGIRLSPILDMLNVRYVFFRGQPPPGARPGFQGPDYWVMVNPAALPRAYVPRRVEVVTNAQERLALMAAPAFDPRAVAYLEAPRAPLPTACQGRAEIRDEIPTRVTLAVALETPGLVVLADQWDQGWRARFNGQPVPILRVNHALRGVMLPAGAGTLEFRYEPASLTWGLWLGGTALALMGLGFMFSSNLIAFWPAFWHKHGLFVQ